MKTFAEFRHCIIPPKTCVLPHCVVEDNENLRQCFPAVFLLVLLWSSERAFHSEPCIIYAPRTARKICLRKPKNSKHWTFSPVIFYTIGLVYASKDHPFISSWLLKLLFSLIPSSYSSFTLQLVWTAKMKERKNEWKKMEDLYQERLAKGNTRYLCGMKVRRCFERSSCLCLYCVSDRQ